MLYFGLSVVLLSIVMIGYVSLVSIGTEHILENVGERRKGCLSRGWDVKEIHKPTRN